MANNSEIITPTASNKTPATPKIDRIIFTEEEGGRAAKGAFDTGSPDLPNQLLPLTPSSSSI
ncbi:UNVERIFIED_CONTAM: hypothetical protein FKN15_060021 [Acipenser sinensis]